MNLQVLLGYRILFQRVSDQAVYSGWVESSDGYTLRVSPSYDDFEVEVEDVMTATVTYQFATAHFECVVGAKHQKDIRVDIRGPISLSAADEDPRIRRVLTCALKQEEDEVEVEIVDVSVGGLALLSPKPLEKGSRCELIIDVKPVPLSVRGEVRYSIQTDDGEHYRAGVFFQNQDRITRGRWRAFIQQSAWEEMSAGSSRAA